MIMIILAVFLIAHVYLNHISELSTICIYPSFRKEPQWSANLCSTKYTKSRINSGFKSVQIKP